MALQGVEGATEQRRHAAKCGRFALEPLGELKSGLLGGTLAPANPPRLPFWRSAVKEGSGDAGSDSLLSETGRRAEVEIAGMAAR